MEQVRRQTILNIAVVGDQQAAVKLLEKQPGVEKIELRADDAYRHHGRNGQRLQPPG